MAVYRPTYTDPKTGERKHGKVWWYGFTSPGKRIAESAKTTRKTIATEAEKKRRLELERGYNAVEDERDLRVRSIAELADEHLERYRLRHPRSATFAEFAIGHLKKHLGTMMRVDVNADTVVNYQSARLRQSAAPKTINEETGFLLRILEEQGDVIRAKLRRTHTLKLKVRNDVSKAYSQEETAALLEAATKLRTPCMYTALILGLHAGLRDHEIRGLQWQRVDLKRLFLTVGDSKTDAGTGRTIPINDELLAALGAHLRWFEDKFGMPRPDWYVFPFGKPQPTDPSRPMVTLKTAWQKAKADAEVKGRFHDTRHTFITELAESGEASDETIRDLAGHVSKQMLKHYSHIGMEAKRRAVAALTRGRGSKVVAISKGVTKESTKVSNS